MMTAFKLLARFRRLRGTPLDIFGYTAERRRERALIGAYRRRIDELLSGLDARNLLAAEIAAIPERIRGFGHVKDRHLAARRSRRRHCSPAGVTARPPRRRGLLQSERMANSQ